MEQNIEEKVEKKLFEKIKEKVKEISPLGVAERQKRRDENLQKVLRLAKDKGEITNDMVQKELLVSDPTATNYLNELVNNGKLRKTGKTRDSFYQLVNS